MMAGAEDLGKKLLAEVEEMGLDEIFHTLRIRDENETQKYFNFPPLDRLLQGAISSLSLNTKPNAIPPTIELLSLTPGGGKTHLFYLLCARAALPSSLGGREACVIILDTDGAFSISRLAQQTRILLQTKTNELDAQFQLTEALKHVHIFRPQSLASTIATLQYLPSYLFAQNRHYSFDRAVSFVALDSASAFYWQDRAEVDDATLLDSSSKPESACIQLASALRITCTALRCPAIVSAIHNSSVSTNNGPGQQRSFRLPIPSLSATLRLVVQRVPVRKFPPKISVEGALQEAEARKQAVEAGKFECFVNEWGLEPVMMRKFESAGTGFGFRITGQGVVVDDGEA